MLIGMLGRVTIGAVVLIGIVSVAALFSVFYLPSHYQQASLRVIETNQPVDVSAPAWAVFSLTTGDILFSANAGEALPIASVTKLATAAALLEGYDMMATTTTTWQDIYTEGRAGGLKVGEEFSREELLFPLLLESSNDAAVTLEGSLSKGELISAMNNFAQSKGLSSTTFQDSSGLSPSNKSSVNDLVKLAYLINKDQPHITDITRLKQFLTAEHSWQNNNPFTKSAGYVGGKHGFTPEAGRTAVAIFEEQFSKNQIAPIGYVVLGSTDLTRDVGALRELVRTGVYYR